MTDNKDIKQVVIVGGGPVGLLGCWIFANLGIKVTLIERFPGRLSVPKAHALNPRSLEICRQHYISTDQIRTKGSPRKESNTVRFRVNLSGEEIGSLPYERMDADVLQLTPEMIHNISQPEFQDLLVELLKNQPDIIEVKRDTDYVSCTQTEDGYIHVNIRNNISNELSSINTQYLIGCDGAGSTVRNSLGIPMLGEPNMHKIMTFHLNLNIHSIVGDKGAGMLHWILDPKGRGNFIAYNLRENCVMMHHFDPQKDPESSFDETKIRNIVDAAIGKKVPYDILNKATWAHTRQVAKQYRVGNVFLAGDSAHSFPPTGGLGLNSGIADIHNIAWKIGAVINGWAGENLLYSYESERRPIAEINSKQSVKNGQKIYHLLREFKFNNVDENSEQARAEMNRRLKDPEIRRRIRDAVDFQREHFDNLNLHLGYQYKNDWMPDSSADYVPSFTVGSRLPHTWIIIIGEKLDTQFPIEPTDLSYSGDEYLSNMKWNSTLDLVHPQYLTLITTQKANDTLSKLKAEIKIPFHHTKEGIDFIIPQECIWWRKAFEEICDGLIVRPDQHIALLIKDDDTDSVKLIKQFLDMKQ